MQLHAPIVPIDIQSYRESSNEYLAMRKSCARQDELLLVALGDLLKCLLPYLPTAATWVEIIGLSF